MTKSKMKVWFILPVFCLVTGVAFGAEALITGYHLQPASVIVGPGEVVKLKLIYCQLKSKPIGDSNKKSDNDELAPLVSSKYANDDLASLPELDCEGENASNVQPVTVQWDVATGPGQITGDKNGATYQAPATKPAPNKATVTVTFNNGKGKTILLSAITILDEVKTYTGTFTLHDVSVESEYTTDLAGNIRWEFEEYYDLGGWREYTGSGKAAYSVERVHCSGGPANFPGVPVEGRMKVYDDKRYEFIINLVSEEEATRMCRRDDYKWEEEYTPGGGGMSSGDPCATSESYEHYTDITNLTDARNGSCDNVINRFQMGWSFKAVE